MKSQTDETCFIIKPSSIVGAGVGVFALCDIAKDTRLDLFPDWPRTRTYHNTDIPTELAVYCIANPDGETFRCPSSFNRMSIGWYLNHSTSPNAALNISIGYISSRVIKKDEEILIDYRTFDTPIGYERNFSLN